MTYLFQNAVYRIVVYPRTNNKTSPNLAKSVVLLRFAHMEFLIRHDTHHNQLHSKVTRSGSGPHISISNKAVKIRIKSR